MSIQGITRSPNLHGAATATAREELLLRTVKDMFQEIFDGSAIRGTEIKALRVDENTITLEVEKWKRSHTLATPLWYVRLIKEGTYHPTDHGAVVEGRTPDEAINKYKQISKLDNSASGEFAFYEPTAEIVEMDRGVGLL